MKKLLLMLTVLVVVAGMSLNVACKKSDSEEDESLTGVTWVLQSIQYSAQTVIQIEDTFTIVFNADGTVTMQVDCNQCGGTYQTGDNSSLSFPEAMSCTEAHCGNDSRDTEFHDALGTASSYQIDGSTLEIFFGGGSSKLVFQAQ